MTPEETAKVPEDRESASRVEVRKAAARVAVEASKRTGRPVDPRVKELAES